MKISKLISLFLSVSFLALLLQFGCGGKLKGIIGGDEVTPAIGTVGNACNDDGTCNAGLTCVESTCADISTLPDVGDLGQPCNPDGTCNTSLVCQSGVCAQDPAVSDQEAPTVSIVLPIQNEKVLLPQCLIVADASDNIGVARVEFFDGDTRLGEDTDGSDGWSFDWNITLANVGAHNLVARAYDAAGNMGESTIVNITIRFPAFAKTYGTNRFNTAYYTLQTSDGGYLIASEREISDTGNYDAVLIKLDSNDRIEWQKIYGQESRDSLSYIQQTSDGGYIAAGSAKSTATLGSGKSDAWILKLFSNGEVDWQKLYGKSDIDAIGSIQQTSDGYIAIGSTMSMGAGHFDIWVLKLFSDGTVDWQKTYGNYGTEYANSIQQTSDGYIIAGSTNSSGAGNFDAWVLKLNLNGTVVNWQKTYGTAKRDFIQNIQKTSDGGYIMAGYSNSFGIVYDNAWVLKLFSDGTLDWQKNYGGSGSDYAHWIQQTSDGYIVAGKTNSSGAGNFDAWVLKLNSSGDIEWQKTYGGSGKDQASSVQQTADGGYMAVGETCSFGAGNCDAWILKLKPDGSIDPSCLPDIGEIAISTASSAPITDEDSHISPSTPTGVSIFDIPATPSVDASTIIETLCSD